MDASLGAVVTRQIRLQGITVGHRDGFEAMLTAMQQHQIKPVTGDVFSFEDLKAAMDSLRQGGHFGKIMIDFTD